MDPWSREGLPRTALLLSALSPHVVGGHKIDAGWNRSSALAVIDTVSIGTAEPKAAKRCLCLHSPQGPYDRRLHRTDITARPEAEDMRRLERGIFSEVVQQKILTARRLGTDHHTILMEASGCIEAANWFLGPPRHFYKIRNSSTNDKLCYRACHARSLSSGGLG